MSGCATPATQSGAAPRASQAPNPGPRAPPSAICTTPATQNDRGCAIVPRLPREIKVDVTKCHACHAEVARRHGRHGRLNQDQARHPVPSVPRLRRKNDRGCAIVPRLPREIKVDVTKCHACEIIVCLVCVCVCVKLVCVCEVSVKLVFSLCVCELVCVCEVSVKLVYVKFVCVKLLLLYV